jgi:small subunit ribosomal protein S16
MKSHLEGGEKVAVKIRLKRMGAKKRPFYRVVVADSRMPRDGRFIEEIGYYNPLTDPIEVKINEEKAADWLKKGAIPTDTVKYLFKNIGILADKKTANQQSENEA